MHYNLKYKTYKIRTHQNLLTKVKQPKRYTDHTIKMKTTYMIFVERQNSALSKKIPNTPGASNQYFSIPFNFRNKVSSNNKASSQVLGRK